MKPKGVWVRIPALPPCIYNHLRRDGRAGRTRSPAKGVFGLKPGSRVRIPLSPPLKVGRPTLFFLKKFELIYKGYAPIAQLDRAPDYGSGG